MLQVNAWVLKQDKFEEEHYTAPPEVHERRLEAFQKADEDDDGHISPDHMHVIMMNHIGEVLSEREIGKMIKDAERNRDGEIDHVNFGMMVADAEAEESRPRTHVTNTEVVMIPDWC